MRGELEGQNHTESVKARDGKITSASHSPHIRLPISGRFFNRGLRWCFLGLFVGGRRNEVRHLYAVEVFDRRDRDRSDETLMNSLR